MIIKVRKTEWTIILNSVSSYSNATPFYFTLTRSLDYCNRIFEIVCLILLVIWDFSSVYV